MTLARELDAALGQGHEALYRLWDAQPACRRDLVLVLHQIYDLHRRPLHELGDRAHHQHHPVVAWLKQRLEARWMEELDGAREATGGGDDTVEAMEALAARDRAPAIYDWLAREAHWEAALRFLSLEGGPDDLLDDLVATCQVALPVGSAKTALARTYWNEMGNGDGEQAHNVLYRRFVEAVDLPQVPREEQPTEALERAALPGLVATNRALQPEMVGVLGFIELQAGSHCHYVDQGLERLGGPPAARTFYQAHAVAEPRDGRSWLEDVVAPLVERCPDWGGRILRGAAWGRLVNAAFHDWAERLLVRSPV